MPDLALHDLTRYVEDNIGSFHQARLASLERLNLQKILKRKNPYLFRAKNVLTAQDFVKTILDAHLSSQEETMFGDFLEGIAIFACAQVYGGGKSAAEGIDLEFDNDGIHYIVTIKSGPNWGNSGQIREMKTNFLKAQRVLRTSRTNLHVIAVNGCCYGKDDRPEKEGYLKLCGQRFWTFLSGNDRLYTDLIEPLGHRARERNEAFMEAYAGIINRFTQEFASQFCDQDGRIAWERLVELTSQMRRSEAAAA
jgi:hypothetical protein